jgi:hypothetical protein
MANGDIQPSKVTGTANVISTPNSELMIAPRFTEAIADAAVRRIMLVRRRKNMLKKPEAVTSQKNGVGLGYRSAIHPPIK